MLKTLVSLILILLLAGAIIGYFIPKLNVGKNTVEFMNRIYLSIKRTRMAREIFRGIYVTVILTSRAIDTFLFYFFMALEIYSAHRQAKSTLSETTGEILEEAEQVAEEEELKALQEGLEEINRYLHVTEEDIAKVARNLWERGEETLGEVISERLSEKFLRSFIISGSERLRRRILGRLIARTLIMWIQHEAMSLDYTSFLLAEFGTIGAITAITEYANVIGGLFALGISPIIVEPFIDFTMRSFMTALENIFYHPVFEVLTNPDEIADAALYCWNICGSGKADVNYLTVGGNPRICSYGFIISDKKITVNDIVQKINESLKDKNITINRLMICYRPDNESFTCEEFRLDGKTHISGSPNPVVREVNFTRNGEVIFTSYISFYLTAFAECVDWDESTAGTFGDGKVFPRDSLGYLDFIVYGFSLPTTATVCTKPDTLYLVFIYPSKSEMEVVE